MDEKLLEIREYTGEGYKPLIDFGAWRVAILRFVDGMQPERIDMVERHNNTDEVFVLLGGRAVLFVGRGKNRVNDLYPQRMEPGKLYNIKRSSWHTILLSLDASVMLVENRDTGVGNTDYSPLKPEHRRLVLDVVRRGWLEGRIRQGRNHALRIRSRLKSV